MNKKNTLKVVALLTTAIAILTKSTSSWSAPIRAKPYLKLLGETEEREGIPHNLLVRIAYQESRFREDIISGQTVSSSNAQGIMQIIPRWHPNVNPLEPSQAIPYAGKYLRKLYNIFGNWKDATASYNWGQGNLAKFKKGVIKKMPLETKNYIKEISADIPNIN